MIEVAGLVKVYDDVRVVDDVHIEIADGEIFGLLGANGAGKSTTIECLQGLRRPDAGKLRVLGLDPVVDRARLRTLIGSQLQDAALPDRLRVGEALALFGRSRRSDWTGLLARWGLADKVRTSFADLSGGQRQRLFVVLALLNEPRVVFLDELTQGLDPAARRDVWQVIRDVRDAGTTVVLVSHFADEVEALCDRVTVMSGGRIVDSGTPRQIVERHAGDNVITFTAPVDLDLARMRSVSGVRRVDDHGDRVRVAAATAAIAAVCALTLDELGNGPDDLHVIHPNLDDALLHLIGAQK